jgi:hypothetical protein
MTIELKTETKITTSGPVQTWWISIDGSYVQGSVSTTLEQAQIYYDTLKESGGKAVLEQTLKSETI